MLSKQAKNASETKEFIYRSDIEKTWWDFLKPLKRCCTHINTISLKGLGFYSAPFFWIDDQKLDNRIPICRLESNYWSPTSCVERVSTLEEILVYFEKKNLYMVIKSEARTLLFSKLAKYWNVPLICSLRLYILFHPHALDTNFKFISFRNVTSVV